MAGAVTMNVYAVNSEAALSWQLFEDYKTQRGFWDVDAASEEDFYLGRQWTEKEIKQIEKRGMAPLVINRTMPVIQQEISIFLSKRPSFRYFPLEDSDPATAHLFNVVADYIWQLSDGDQQALAMIQDYFVVGAGYMQVYIDRYADDGRGEVKFRAVSPFDVYPDPNSRERDLSDARYILVSRLIDRSTLRFMYPDKVDLIEQAEDEEGAVVDRPMANPQVEGAPITPSDYQYQDTLAKSGKVRIIERHELVRKPYWKVYDLYTGEVNIYPLDAYDPSAVEGVKATKIWRIRERVTLTAGRRVTLYSYENPTSRYSIVPAFLHHQRTPFPKGDVAMIKGLQKEINKRRSIMIHNATLAGNYRLMAERGSITNKQDWELKGSNPGFILEYQVGAQGGQPPKEMLPQQLPTAWIQLEQEAKGDLEYTLSVFAHQMGSAQDAPETFRGLLALEETGQRKIMHKARPANLAFRNLGRVIADFVQATYRGPKMIRIAGEDAEGYVEEYLNKITVGMDGKISRENDITVGKVDLIVLDGTSMPTNRMALLNLYLEMFQLGIIDKAEVLKKTDIVDREAVLERMGEIQQLMAQAQQLEEAMKNTEGLNQTLRRQLTQAGVQIETMKGAEAVKEEVMATKFAERANRERMADALKLLKDRGAVREMEAKAQVANFLAQQKLAAAARKSQEANKK